MLKALGIKNVWQGFRSGKSTIQDLLDGVRNGKIKVEEVIPNKVLKGDTNGDGKVNMTDVIVLQQYLIDPVKYPTDGKNLPNGNNYGSHDKYYPELSIEDLVAVQMIVSGFKKNGYVDLDGKQRIKNADRFVFSYYYDIYQAQDIREKWNMQY